MMSRMFSGIAIVLVLAACDKSPAVRTVFSTDSACTKFVTAGVKEGGDGQYSFEVFWLVKENGDTITIHEDPRDLGIEPGKTYSVDVESGDVINLRPVQACR